MLKKFNTLAQWIGLIVITLATAYGSLAVSSSMMTCPIFPS